MNASSPMEEEDQSAGNWQPVLGAAAALIAIAVIIFATYRIRYREDMSEQANTFANTFIHSSPVVEGQLGQVERVREVKEQHLTGQHPGWYLDYDVTGRHANGVVDMRLTANPNYDSWNVSIARLDSGNKTIALR